MSGIETISVPLHEDPELFREAVRFTSATTAFNARLIEKDYFSSILLNYIFAEMGNLPIFKGGTCLAKVHAGFYRLSEDLDFMVPMPVESKRAERRRQVEPFKKMLETLPGVLPVFKQVEPLKGANESTQHIGVLGYQSLISQQMETIIIEVGLREPLLLSVRKQETRTILLDPISREPMVAPFTTTCISKKEAYAEKFRAALTRREAAIRDYFDIDYAVDHLGLEIHKPSFIRLIRFKLDVPGNEPIDVTDKRLSLLRRQQESNLKPVLRNMDYQAFDLMRAFQLVTEVASQMKKT
jgi:predicted nucleotidyltransferase component of viral defense system